MTRKTLEAGDAPHFKHSFVLNEGRKKGIDLILLAALWEGEDGLLLID